MMNRLLFCLLFSVLSILASAQEKLKVEILHADEVVMDPSISEAQRLLGNVRFKYKDALMFCDSAYRFNDGNFIAYSKVRIVQGDSLQLFSDRLSIDNTTKVAHLSDNIRLREKDMTLTTDLLDYDFDTDIASYYGGGKITSKTNSNILTSEQGFYDTESKFFQFRKDVELVNPEYTISSDTLRYSSNAEQAFFYGPTTINSEDTEIYCENGWYNTVSDLCQFNENALITSGSTIMKGDSIFYNGKTGDGEVFRNVEIQDTTSNYLIQGEYGRHNERERRSLVTGKAEMIQFFDGDSLFLHADTLLALPDSIGKQVIHASERVKFFKSDLQGKADSLTYSESDSLLSLFGKPIIWSKENQISGDQIDLTLNGGKIREMHIDKNSFIISEAIPGKYNQIKGKRTIGYFTDNSLRRIDVFGNGQIVYFPSEEKDGRTSITGLNRVDCSDVSLEVKENEIVKVALLTKPSGALHPLQKAQESEFTLEGFFWNTLQRPMSREDIFLWLPQ